MDSDASLLTRVSSGDREALGAIMDRYEARVFQFARALARNEDMAADATQEAFLLLLRSPHSYAPTRGTLQSFLLGVVRIIVLKMFRKKRALAETGLDGVEKVSSDPHPGPPPEQEGQLVALAAAVEGLTPIQRDVVRLRFQHELPLAEIAGALSLPLNTVKSHLRRGVESLRNVVKKGDEYAGV